MGCSIALFLRYASMTRVSSSLNYSYILPKQTEERKGRITAKNLGKYSMQKAINRSYRHGEDAHSHTGLWNSGSDGKEGLKSCLTRLVSTSQEKAGACGSDPQFRLPSPRSAVWYWSLFQATQTLFASVHNGTATLPLPPGEPGVKMHYRLQLPLFLLK